MKLAEIDIDQLVLALGKERSAWVKLKTEEKRQLTEAAKRRRFACLGRLNTS
jgi:hypothetical protein